MAEDENGEGPSNKEFTRNNRGGGEWLGDVRARRGALASPETDRLLHVGLRLKPSGPRQHTKELHNLTSKRN
jgi:hypothetical protein